MLIDHKDILKRNIDHSKEHKLQVLQTAKSAKENHIYRILLMFEGSLAPPSQLTVAVYDLRILESGHLYPLVSGSYLW